jgi:hypothetical protein
MRLKMDWFRSNPVSLGRQEQGIENKRLVLPYIWVCSGLAQERRDSFRPVFTGLDLGVQECTHKQH